MKFSRSVYSLAAAATLGLAGLGATASAHAGDVYWQVGVSQPGVHVGVSNAPPVVYQPAPVVVYPQPHVVYAPPPPPQVVYRPAPVYYPQPQVVYVPQPYYTQAGWVYPGYRHGWERHHGPRGGWDRHDDRGGYQGNPGYPGYPGQGGGQGHR